MPKQDDPQPVMVPGLNHSRGWGLTLDQMWQADAEDRLRNAERLAGRVERAAPAPEPEPAPERATGEAETRSGATPSRSIPDSRAERGRATENDFARSAPEHRSPPPRRSAKRSGRWWTAMGHEEITRF